MKILVDENIPRMTAEALRRLDRDVKDIRGTADEGMDDAGLWEMAQREGRLLVTTDKGFAERRYEPHHGVLIVRLRQPNRESIHQRVTQVLAQIGTDQWPGLLVAVRDRVQSVWRAGAER